MMLTWGGGVESIAAGQTGANAALGKPSRHLGYAAPVSIFFKQNLNNGTLQFIIPGVAGLLFVWVAACTCTKIVAEMWIILRGGYAHIGATNFGGGGEHPLAPLFLQPCFVGSAESIRPHSFSRTFDHNLSTYENEVTHGEINICLICRTFKCCNLT